MREEGEEKKGRVERERERGKEGVVLRATNYRWHTITMLHSK